MSISNAKATFGLDGVGTGTRPLITQSALVGSQSAITSLPSSSIAFVASLYLQADEDTGTLDTTDMTVANATQAAVAASGVLTLTGNAVAGQTVTIGAKTYTWRATVSATANEVKIGDTASDSIDNLIAAITAGSGGGTLYGSATTANADATASAGAGDTMDVEALVAGTAGNSIATTETMTAGSFASATLTGGLQATGWTGASPDFQGNAIAAPSDVEGIFVHCQTGAVVISQSTDVLIPLTAGGKALIANPAGMPDFYGDLVFTAAADNTALLITAFAS
jgi:hypothetical protein